MADIATAAAGRAGRQPVRRIVHERVDVHVRQYMRDPAPRERSLDGVARAVEQCARQPARGKGVRELRDLAICSREQAHVRTQRSVTERVHRGLAERERSAVRRVQPAPAH
jgi:hypothetical protein